MTALKICMTVFFLAMAFDYFREGVIAAMDPEGRGKTIFIRGLVAAAFAIVSIVLTWLWL